MPKIILALGADIKSRFLLARGTAFTFGPDIGDLSNPENLALFKRHIYKAVKGIKPDIIACDMHPQYFSSIFAQGFTANLLLPVQHHHAHIASVMQEHQLKKDILGVSFDGTGFGQDGNLWGGEFLRVSKKGFQRLGHLKYRMMPGADKAVSEPWRMALSILGSQAFPFLKKVPREEQELVLKMLAKRINSPLSSSAGRLFDAAAALLGVCEYAAYEAEGPIKLEALCDETVEAHYEFTIVSKDGCYIVDTDDIFLRMRMDLTRGRDRRLIASTFHNSMAEIILQMIRKLSRTSGIKNAALSGGVFQNRFLKEKTIKKLTKTGVKVFTNERTPVNDFNISLGQYFAAS
ncbi:MAG: hypothetical protein V1662_05530 [Candidatus Omnitrophota bacterium]